MDFSWNFRARARSIFLLFSAASNKQPANVKTLSTIGSNNRPCLRTVKINNRQDGIKDIPDTSQEYSRGTTDRFSSSLSKKKKKNKETKKQKLPGAR